MYKIIIKIDLKKKLLQFKKFKKKKPNNIAKYKIQI